MSTVIDSLIITLGLDIKSFKSSQKDAEKGLKNLDDDSKKLNETNKKANSGVKDLSASLIRFFAVLSATSYIKKFIADINDNSAAIERLHRNIGTGVETISAWGQAAEQMGGSAEGLQGTLQMLSEAQTEMQLTGNTAMLPYLRALGVGMADAQGKARPLEDILYDLSGAFSGLDRTTAANIGKTIGIDPGTLNLLLEGQGAVKAMLAEQKALGVVTAQQGPEAVKYAQALAGVRQAANGLGREYVAFVTPALTWLFKALTTGAKYLREHSGLVKGAAVVIGVALVPALLSATAALWAFLSPVIVAVAPVLALAAAIGVLWDDYQVWKEGGKSFIDWSDWEPGIKAAIDAIKIIRDLIRDMQNAIDKFINTKFPNIKEKLGLGKNDSVIGKLFSETTKTAAMGPLGYVRLLNKAAPTVKTEINKPIGKSLTADVVKNLPGDYQSVKKEDKAVARDLSKMTVNQVINAQQNKEFDKAGKYQISMPVLENAIKSLKLKGDEKFDKVLQDRIFKEVITTNNNSKESVFSNSSSSKESVITNNISKESATTNNVVQKPVAASIVANLVARGEGDYSSVNFGKAGGYKAGKRDLENMTINQIVKAQDNKEFNAVGRYQLIAPTLKQAIKELGLKGDEKFDKNLQDRIFKQFLTEKKRPEIGDYINGKSDNLNAAVLALSKEWASVANPMTGKSFYDGVGNNKASITAKEAAEALKQARASAATTVNNSSSMNIGEISVYTQATDAAGIVRDIPPAIRANKNLANQVESGLQG